MKDFINKVMEYWGKKDIVEQLIWLTAIALLVVVGSFSAYYYFDRYVATDISPAELELGEIEDLIRENPDNPDLRVALADKYFQLGLYDEAIKQSYMVIEQYGDEYNYTYFLAGMSYFRLGDAEESIPVLERFIELRKDDPMAKIDTRLQTAYYYAGYQYYELEDYEGAIPHLLAGLEVGTADADSMYKLAQSYFATSQYDLALEQYHEAVRFVPDFYEVYTGMIECYSVLDMPDKVAYARGMQLFIEENYDGAITHLYNSYEADSEFVPNLLGLGMAYEKVGDYDFALLYLNQALALDPGNFMANNLVGRIQQILQAEGN